jgi:AraC-like DNA-binding protein
MSASDGVPSNSKGSTIGFLARALMRHVGKTGDHATGIPGLSLHRRDEPTEPVPCIYGLGLAFTVQGRKRVMLGEKVLDYGAGGSMLTPTDLPVVAHITHATNRNPYLGLMLKLDVAQIMLVASAMKLPEDEGAHAPAQISIESVGPALLDALFRLVGLLDSPKLLPHLAPLVRQEIIIHLLAGPYGPYLRKLSVGESSGEQIAKTVAWMKQNFSEAKSLEELAARASMGVSSFRKHFRALMGVSPLQFQKQLRLQEARHLMLNENLDAASAAIKVGYESASQFSREYRRMFGAPPQLNVRTLKGGYCQPIKRS